MATLPGEPEAAPVAPAVAAVPPDVDQLFPEQQKSVDELFPVSVERDRYRRQTLGTSPIQDLIFGNSEVNPAARVLDAFGQGFKHGWGSDPAGLSKESVDYLKSSGVFNDYDKGQKSIIKAANESLFRGAATQVIDPIMRGLPGAFGGVQAAIAKVGEEAGQPQVGREAAAMFEAFPTGFRAQTGAPGADVAQMGRNQHLRAVEAEIEKARSVGVIGEGEAGYFGTKPTEVTAPVSGPQEVARPAEAPAPPKIESAPKVETAPEVLAPEVAPEPPKDVHAVARDIAPDTFRDYDALTTRQETFRRWVSELRDTRNEEAAKSAPHVDEINTLQAKIDDPETSVRLRKKYEERIAPLIEERDAHIAEATKGDSPEMANIRQKLMEVDYQRRDLAPEVTRAYQAAREKMPQEAPPEAAAPVEAAPETEVAPKGPEKYTITDPLGSAVDGEKMNVEVLRSKDGKIEGLYTDKGVVKVGPAYRDLPPEEAIAATLGDHPDGTAPDVSKVSKTTSETAPPVPFATAAVTPDVPIAVDVAQKLQAAGRPIEEAQAAGAIQAAYWETRAARFEGRKGTAAEMYAKEAPDIKAGKGVEPALEPALELAQTQRGKIRIREEGRNTITLMKDANASTFIHETGHDWLDRMMKDAVDPEAPAGLIADSQATLKWLGVEKPGDIKTRQHEKFARGFETYMMEGRAPSPALASVFQQFKDWLTKIYNTVKALKAPINEDISGVFDRMLSTEPVKPVIASDLEHPAGFADAHETIAEKTPAPKAAETAITVRDERDAVAAKLPPEDNNARLAETDAGTAARRREARSPEPASDGNAAGPASAQTGTAAESGAVGKGGSEAAPESARPSVGGGKTEPPVSPQSTFTGPDSALVDKAGNIRLDNLGTAEDVNKAIRDAASENNEFIDARRGVVTDGQVLELADALGMDAGQLNTRKLGQAYNAEQIMAARKLLIQSATTVRDAMVKAAAGAEVDIMAYAEAKARHQMIQEQVSGITAEAGRALRAFRKLEGQQEAGQIDAFLKDATGKTLFQLQREAQLGSQLPTPAQVSKFVNNTSKPTWREMVVEAWITALLSGPKTHVANIMGNTISGLWRPIETAAAAVVGKARNLVTGSQDRVMFGEAAAELFGMVHGSREGVVAAYKAFKSEEPQMTSTRQIEQGHPKALPSATVNILGREMEIGGKQARIPLRMLGAEDEFFKSVAFRGDINRQAYALASKENLPPEQFNARVAELSMNPTEAMIEAAKGVADYQTFQTPLGKTGRAVQNFANSHILAKFIVPFVRTPINLLKYAAERSPLGLFAQEVRDNLAGKNGAVARDTQVARITLGTMVGVAAFEMASQGLLTGGGPADKSKKSIMQADGWQDYSVKIGDMYYRYNRLDPFSVILGIAADAYEVSHALGSEHLEKEHLPALVFAAVSKNILNRASLQGASDLIQAVSDPERYGKGYIKGMAGTVVPAFAAQTAQTMDPVVREARTVLDGIKARIPGLSQDLMPKRDVWGEPMTRDGGLGPDIASPIMERRIKNDPVNQALMAANYFPGKLDHKIRGVDLSDQQYDDYARIAGRMAKVKLNAIVGIPGFSQFPEAARKEMMTTAITTSRETAQALIIMQSVHGDNNIMKKATDAKLLKARGTETAH